MTIYVDADACPVIKEVEQVAKKYDIVSVLISDTNHILNSEYSEIIVVDKGADSADFFIVNKCKPNDIVVTHDYGVAAMALAKKAYPIDNNGRRFTDENISALMMQRHIAKHARKAKHHLKGPKKRTKEANINFLNSLEWLILYVSKIT